MASPGFQAARLHSPAFAKPTARQAVLVLESGGVEEWIGGVHADTPTNWYYGFCRKWLYQKCPSRDQFELDEKISTAAISQPWMHSRTCRFGDVPTHSH